MTNEEAVKYTEQCIDRMRDCIDRHQEKGFPVGEMQETLEYYECVLAALKCEKKPTGEPLTLEQLREMDGKAAYLSETNCWVLVTKNPFVPLFTFPDGEQCSAVDWYREVGPAYTYPPAHIDREAWEPCELCGGDKLDGVGFADHFGLRVYLSGGINKPPENERFQFCPKCGRPLTPEAWAMLEKRLRG